LLLPIPEAPTGEQNAPGVTSLPAGLVTVGFGLGFVVVGFGLGVGRFDVGRGFGDEDRAAADDDVAAGLALVGAVVGAESVGNASLNAGLGLVGTGAANCRPAAS
jgi:hypothetical protein